MLRRNRALLSKTCKGCNQSFKTHRVKQMFCDYKCRQDWHNGQRQAAIEQYKSNHKGD